MNQPSTHDGGDASAGVEPVRIGSRLVGPGHPVFVVAEIGINHNGSVDQAKRLVDAALASGCDGVKFQKRTIEAVYSPEELARPRTSAFGDTNGDLKRGLELSREAYVEIDRHCRAVGIPWFASCWDPQSVDLIASFDVPCFKIASACLTDDALLLRHRERGRPVLLSTGMSTMEEIDRAVDRIGRERLVVLHCTGSYPSQPEELNLKVIPRLLDRYRVPVGYSGHEVGLATTLAAVSLGACVIERHLTLDRAQWGSDQAASVEPVGMARLVKDIRAIEAALGDGVKRVYESEIPARDKLRRTGR
ncbi:MAG: N-acetylneuraminate synthase [Acidimicrobiia bacterium]|nr:N-acetylneuraminate synthase [Acidimicrobiia bacterium]